MNDKSTLITGGSGLLGNELQKKLPRALIPTSKELDISNQENIKKFFLDNRPKLVIHGAAYMPPSNSDKNPDIAIETNIIGTSLLTTQCIKQDIRMIYISTDYVYPGNNGNYKEEDAMYPVNKYAWSKLGGECAVRMYDKGLVVHTSFGPNEFPYNKAFVDQWTSKLAVSEFVQRLMNIINTNATGVINIGGKRQTVYEYAKKISPRKEIGELSINEMLPDYVLPKDTSLNNSRYEKLTENNN